MNAMDSVLTYENETFDTRELYNVLGFSTVPTDRELEAKIIQKIQKYSYYEDSTEYESDKSLYWFFHKVYDFFFTTVSKEGFEEEKEEEEEDRLEGFTNADLKNEVESLIKNKQKRVEKLDTINQEMKKTTGEGSIPSVVKNVEYTKDVVNPILKQTIQRLIVINSQDRHLFSSNYFTKTISTNFTVEIEPLKDVLSLKLFSYSIPYTWYTVNNDYGSNFFYLKGTSPGLSDCEGKYDFQVSILPGTYTPVQLKDAINDSFTVVKNNYTDVSFGTTRLDYNVNNTTASFTIDIQNIYHESQHLLDWVNWTSPDQPNRDNILNNIPIFLGYDSKTYDINTIYSVRDKLGIPSDGADLNDTSFYISLGTNGDVSNNYFQIVHYLNPLTTVGAYYKIEEYMEGVSTILDTLTIPLSGITRSGNYSRKSIEAELVNQISTHPYFVGNGTKGQGSYLERIYTEGDNYSYYKMILTVDRTQVQSVAHSKFVVVFPNESTLIGVDSNKKPIWTNIPGNPNNSCFCFDPSAVELNNLIAEFPLFDSNYILNNDAYIELACNINGYIDASNNFLMKINRSPDQQLGYSLTEYDTLINDAIENPIQKPEKQYADFLFNYPEKSFEIDKNSIPQLYFDFNVYFNNNHYKIYFNDISLNNDSLHKEIKFDLSNINVFTSQYKNVSEYILRDHGKPLFSIVPKYNNAVGFDVHFIGTNGIIVPDQVGTGTGYKYNVLTNFLTDYINSIKKFTDATINTPLFLSTVENNIEADTYQLKLTVNVSKRLSQKDYVMHLYDISNNKRVYLHTGTDISGTVNTSSSWQKHLNYTNYTYNLKDISYNLNTSLTNVSGSGSITGKTITIIDGCNNFFYFKPQSYATGLVTGTSAVGTLTPSNYNDVYITLSGGTYTNNSLFNALNTAFSNNPLTRGTFIGPTAAITVSGKNVQYCKLRVNINHIFTAKDYIINFYDVVSFVKCYVGSTSVRNTTWDTTLGWILGFHEQISYALFMYTTPTSNSIAKLSGETSVNVNLYKYFLISLDDFNQNRLNDGIVTVTNPESKIPLPSYSAIAKYTCDSNGNIVTSGSLETASNNLTVNQIYALNQIIRSQQSLLKVYSQGPYVKDIFGIVPFKIPSTQGDPISEFGGTLQNQERKYFGPVNIRRLQIQLFNDQGNIMDLNGQDWHFTLLCEQLYQHDAT